MYRTDAVAHARARKNSTHPRNPGRPLEPGSLWWQG